MVVSLVDDVQIHNTYERIAIGDMICETRQVVIMGGSKVVLLT